MMPIVWHSSARTDLLEIIRYIADRDSSAARRLRDRLESAVLPLADHPYLYRPGRVPGTREVVVHPNYVLVYRVARECIEIVSVLHSRQQYPDGPA